MARLAAAVMLLVAGAAGSPAQAQAQEVDASVAIPTFHTRVTYYTLRGVMADGGVTHPGAAACSARFPFGTQFALPNGEVVTCEDRGLGDRYWDTWVDVWSTSSTDGQDNVAAYGDWTDLPLVRWGWASAAA